MAEKIEVSFQPEIRPHSTAMAFMRDVMYRKLVREWHQYCLLKPRALLRDVVGFLKGLYINYVVEREGMRADPTVVKHGSITGEYISSIR